MSDIQTNDLGPGPGPVADRPPTEPLLTSGQVQLLILQVGSLLGLLALVCVLNPAYAQILLTEPVLLLLMVFYFVSSLVLSLVLWVVLNRLLPPSAEDQRARRLWWSWLIVGFLLIFYYLPAMLIIILGAAAIQIMNMFRALNG